MPADPAQTQQTLQEPSLDKRYDLHAVEERLSTQWANPETYGPQAGDNAPPFCVMMPPPNVTGSLHIGHALNHTLQDVLTRHHRRRGFTTLWQPGTDHAGIATQMVVERQLAGEGKTKNDLGRERFIERVWQWREESGGTIVGQLHRLGTSPYWARERFTMDEGCNHAVRRIFVQMYRDSLIYRDKRLVNWDPSLLTAISDLEINNEEQQGKLWHLRYPLTDDPSRHLVVATTRPETMLGDTCVAVHPEDERFSALVGKTVTLPLTGRIVAIVADPYADPEQGSGAVKITPAHDFNDFEVGKRQRVPFISIFDQHAHILAQAEVWTVDEAGRFGAECQLEAMPEAYAGLDRYAARERIIADLDAQGLLETIEDITNTIPKGDRGGAVIEPRLTDQWYCDAHTLAQPAIAAVRDGRTKFVPEHWANTYFQWMENIQPWCISRQLWWGHQIPAWYGPDGSIYVAETEEEAQALAGDGVALTRDEDVLDTWFSSGLWPFSTLGWPEKTPELEAFYPGSVLVTAFDIIFFWVARMMMMGLYAMGDVPFREVYIHALVRDEKGQKMSKTKGNVIDPLDLIADYGADALRMTMTALAAQGRDIKLSRQRVESYRNFTTKLWNAARYTQMAGVTPVPDFDPGSVTETMNRWIVGEVVRTQKAVDHALTAYRFNEAADRLYQFAWGTFCDWYLEFTKPILREGSEAAIAETRATTGWALDQILSLMNPIMPFVTEELWERLGEALPTGRSAPLIDTPWPDLPDSLVDAQVLEDVDWLVRVISAVRTLRAEMSIPPGQPLSLLLKDLGPRETARLDSFRELIVGLARLESVAPLPAGAPMPDKAAQSVVDTTTLVVPLEGVIDLDKERARLTKAIDKERKEIEKIDKKLSNESFLAKAPEDVIDEQKHRREEAQSVVARLQSALDRIS